MAAAQDVAELDVEKESARREDLQASRVLVVELDVAAATSSVVRAQLFKIRGAGVAGFEVWSHGCHVWDAASDRTSDNS